MVKCQICDKLYKRLDNAHLKKQYSIDRSKDELAKKNGYNIIRIRESEKELVHKI